MIQQLVQFFLIDHLAMTGLVVGGICGALKAYIVNTQPGHPHYRGSR